jgi:hypothetical protein
MNTGKNIFWKKFNLQIFLLIALCFFIATLMVECVWNLIAKDPVSLYLPYLPCCTEHLKQLLQA